MGIIKKQSIQGSIITYIAVFIGFINTAILLPKLQTEVVGLISVLISYTVIITQFASLGFGTVNSRMFPYFRNKANNHNGFMFIAFWVGIIGILLSFIVIFIIKYILHKTRQPDDLFLSYLLYLLPLVFFYRFLNLFDNYYKVNYQSVRGIFLREIVLRSAILLVVALMVLDYFKLNTFILLYVIAFSLPSIIFLFLIVKEKHLVLKPQLGFVTKELRNTMISVGIFGLLSGTTGIIAVNIDKIMIESILGLSETGVYAIAFYFGMIISIPSRSLLRITSAVIAESSKNNDIVSIKSVYEKSTITQFAIGALLFLGIFINLDNIFILLSENYATGRLVIVFIGIAFLSDMLVGTSGQIISFSKQYKLQTYLMVFYVAAIIIGNALLIPKYGIIGAAIATLIAKLLFNISKVITVYLLFRLFPYNIKFIMVALISFLLLFVNQFIWIQDNYLLDIAIRSSIVGISFIVIIYLLNISVDINETINNVMKKVLRVLGFNS